MLHAVETDDPEPGAVSTLAAPGRSEGPGRVRAFARLWLPAVVVFGLGLLAWQWLLPDVLGVKSFLLPRLSDVLRALWDNRDALVTAGWITFKEALGGLVLGSGGAIVAALVLARWRAARERARSLPDRGERDAGDRVRADHERLVRHAEPVVEDRDLGRRSASSPSS